ncbi:hypothetical protein [Rhizobium leguminosarum]|uniref:hypothetical protein n=1 Tax=Rhizobium leguminosarum TaxID=384 RepID=UPI003F99A2B6
MEIDKLPLGAIRYFPERPNEERKAFFEVSFIIEYSLAPGYDTGFEVAVSVPAQDGKEPYETIEDLGAQALPTFFRDLADAVERDLYRSASEKRAREVE